MIKNLVIVESPAKAKTIEKFLGKDYSVKSCFGHIRDLAESLIEIGHSVSVISPADDDTPLPPYVVPAGRAVPVPYNGSVARLSFGFLSASRVRRWLKEGGFDLLHVHEPAVPSLSLLACWVASGPIVATVHTAMPRSRAVFWIPRIRPVT